MNLAAQGIYAILNTESGKVYIGSTAQSFLRRWGQHRSNLRKGSHTNSHLQAAWDKYGEAAFDFGVLEYLDSLGELLLAEQFWMDIYRKEGKELYNIGLTARCRCSEETRRKLRKASTGHCHSEETRARIGEANHRRIISEETRVRMSKASRGRIVSEETRRKLADRGAGLYPAFRHRETGEIIPAGRNLRALCRERGLTSPSMRGVMHGQRAHHKGWVLA